MFNKLSLIHKEKLKLYNKELKLLRMPNE